MKLPIIVTNFKTYESATGERALSLAQIHEKIAQKFGINLVVAVQATDIYRIAQEVSIPVFAQHVDDISFGAHTGYLLSEAVRKAGASGTLINHSEHRVDFSKISSIIRRAQEAGLFTIVCAETPQECAEICQFKPDLVAFEPPELIGGDISVSTAKPDIVADAVSLCHPSKVLVGAGVKNGHDLRIALELGACGVLLASGVTKAQNPEAVLKDLASNMTVRIS